MPKLDFFGGLGNQLFQYSIVILFNKFNSNRITVSLSYYSLNKSSKFCLNDFLINFESAYLLIENSSFISNILFLFRRLIVKSKLGDFFLVCSDKNNISLENFNNFKYFHGYWQNQEIILHNQKFLIDNILFKKPKSNYKIKLKNNSTSIHIRRGDYLSSKNNAVYAELNLEYYLKAIEYIKSKCVNPHFYIFTDDLNWVELNIKDKLPDCEIISSIYSTYDEDFYHMYNCKNNIIANSTFSWWAAFLGKDDQKIVVFPKIWFKNENHKAIKCPKDWIAI